VWVSSTSPEARCRSCRLAGSAAGRQNRASKIHGRDLHRSRARAVDDGDDRRRENVSAVLGREYLEAASLRAPSSARGAPRREIRRQPRRLLHLRRKIRTGGSTTSFRRRSTTTCRRECRARAFRAPSIGLRELFADRLHRDDRRAPYDLEVNSLPGSRRPASCPTPARPRDRLRSLIVRLSRTLSRVKQLSRRVAIAAAVLRVNRFRFHGRLEHRYQFVVKPCRALSTACWSQRDSTSSGVPAIYSEQFFSSG